MTDTNSSEKIPKDYINVAVIRTNHALVKSFLDEDGKGRDIGKFYDAAAMEKLQKEKSKKK